MKKHLTRLKPNTKKKQVLYMLSIGAVLVITVLVVIARKPEQVISEPTITYSTHQPDESKTNATNYNWRGSSDEPKKIRINKIGVDAFVQKAGVDQDKKVAVPNNVHLAGWFADSQKPGQDGLSIITGHVTGRTSDGVFKELQSLQKGDEFEVELGNGQIKKYKIIETVTVKESESTGVLFSQNPNVKSQVNLITCGGDFDDRANQYPDRIIVSAELIN